MAPRTASMLCYIPYVGWIGAILVLSTAKFRFDRTVRFHAFQGLYLFVVWLILYLVVQPALAFSPAGRAGADLASLAQFVVLVAWIWMIIKTAQEQLFRLPFLGELADRSVAEQR